MIVVVSSFRAKVGEEDAIIALHEDWQRCQGLKSEGFVSWELLRKIEAPREFIAIACFRSEEMARAAETERERDAWYCRLVSLIEEGPVHTGCASAWVLRKQRDLALEARL